MANPSRYQLAVMLEHIAAPVAFVARGCRQVSIRALVSDGILSFDQKRIETRLTERGRWLLAEHLLTLQAAE